MSLSNTDVIRILREKITEVDEATSLYEGEDLVTALGDALMILKAKGVMNMLNYTVNTDPEVDPLGITPEPEEGDALLIIYRAAIDILTNEYRGRVKRGEMGIAWKSGLEEESSISAAKEYRSLIDKLENELTHLMLIQSQIRHGVRIQ